VAANDPRVDKVIRLIGTSDQSWEDAARAAISEATKTIRELTAARVITRDLRILTDSTVVYRTELEVAFRIDRHRRADGQFVVVRRLLVVGNRTLTRPELTALLATQRQHGRLEVHVVVPRDPEPLAPLMVGDPSVGVMLTSAQLFETEKASELETEHRLEDFLRQLTDLNIAATGEIGPVNPVHAVQRVLTRAEFDEIIVATLTPTISRWLHMDVPSRLRRVTTTPVTHLATGTD
jgi:dodecin